MPLTSEQMTAAVTARNPLELSFLGVDVPEEQQQRTVTLSFKLPEAFATILGLMANDERLAYNHNISAVIRDACLQHAYNIQEAEQIHGKRSALMARLMDMMRLRKMAFEYQFRNELDQHVAHAEKAIRDYVERARPYAVVEVLADLRAAYSLSESVEWRLDFAWAITHSETVQLGIDYLNECFHAARSGPEYELSHTYEEWLNELRERHRVS